jgi:hypothetical protein
MKNNEEYDETTDHLTPGCPHLHYSICKKLGTEATENWYSYIPKSVTEHRGVIVVRNQGAERDGEGLANMSDIII